MKIKYMSHIVAYVAKSLYDQCRFVWQALQRALYLNCGVFCLLHVNTKFKVEDQSKLFLNGWV